MRELAIKEVFNFGSLRLLLFTAECCADVFEVGRIWYFFESAIGLDNARLNAFKKVNVHNLKVIQVELLHSQGRYRSLIRI